MTAEEIKQFRLKAIRAGYSPQEVNDYLSSGDTKEDRKRAWEERQAVTQTLSTPVNTEPHEGPIKGIAKSVASPFLKLGATAQALSTSKVLGGKGADLSEKNTPLGKVKPITTVKEAAGVGLELASTAALGPSGKAAKIGTKILFNAATGAGYGAGNKLQENGSLGDVAKSAAGGAAFGGTVGLAGAGLGKVKDYFARTLPEKLMNRAIKPTLDEMKKNIKFGTPTLGKELLDEGVKGSPLKLLQIADDNLAKHEDELQKILSPSKGVITKKELGKYLQPAIEQLKRTPGGSDDAMKYIQILSETPKAISVTRANVIKRDLYKVLRDPAYKIDPSLSAKKQAMKTLASGLKTEIENKSGNPALVRELNRKLSIYGRLEDRVVDVMAREARNNGLSLTDAILAAGGIASGGAGGIATGLGAVLLRESAGSVSGMTRGANLLSKGTKIGAGKVGKTGKLLIKKALLDRN